MNDNLPHIAVLTLFVALVAASFVSLAAGPGGEAAGRAPAALHGQAMLVAAGPADARQLDVPPGAGALANRPGR